MTDPRANGAPPSTVPPAARATSRLRALLYGPGTSRAAGAYDGLSAALCERAGFDAIWASSFTISASRGVPDLSLLSMTDYLEAAANMVSTTTVPVLADCDTGFGSCVNAAYMVQRYEASGVAGVCIEDKVFPKTNSFVDARQALVSIDDFARKLDRAKRVQVDPDFVVLARTEALICGAGLDEALERARRYVDAGADAVLIHSKRPTPDEVIAFLEAWDGSVPVVVVPTTYYTFTADDAARAGAAMLIYANHGLRAAVRAVSDALASIMRTGSSTEIEAGIASLDEVFELEHVDEWLALDG